MDTASMTVRKANPVRSPRFTEVDEWVAKKLTKRRNILGMSQKELGALIGMTAQQVHKYETGGSCLVASKLFLAAQALDVNVGYFFEGLPIPASS